jgi:hypothetical protein
MNRLQVLERAYHCLRSVRGDEEDDVPDTALTPLVRAMKATCEAVGALMLEQAGNVVVDAPPLLPSAASAEARLAMAATLLKRCKEHGRFPMRSADRQLHEDLATFLSTLDKPSPAIS